MRREGLVVSMYGGRVMRRFVGVSCGAPRRRENSGAGDSERGYRTVIR